jgi:hypothetical protein
MSLWDLLVIRFRIPRIECDCFSPSRIGHEPVGHGCAIFDAEVSESWVRNM